MPTGISVACGVTQGTFGSECIVQIATIDNSIWQGVVDKELLINIPSILSGEKYVSGRLYANLVSFNNQQALIELPTEDTSVGRRILVPIASVRPEKIPA